MNLNLCNTILLFIVFLFVTNQSFAQKGIFKSKFVQSLLSSKKDSTKSASIIILPALAYAQETGVEYGLLSSYSFYADKTDSLIRSSSIGLIATLTSKKQSNLKLSTDYWTTNNTYHYLADIRYRNFPFNFYGIGDATSEKEKDFLTQKLFRINIEGEKLVAKNYYAGLNAKFEHYRYETTSNVNVFDPNTYIGARGGKYLALGVSQVYDTRNSNTYTTKGFYGRLKYAYAPDIWGGDDFSGSIIDLNLRSFFPFSKKIVLGLNSIYQSTIGQDVPFYLMPQLGNDEMMRGYYQGRFRDKNLLTLQSEIRYRVHPRIGLVAFASSGTVYAKEIDLSRLKFAYGSGIRYFFSLEYDASLRLDYAIGEKRIGEQRQSGFYISLGQAF